MIYASISKSKMATNQIQKREKEGNNKGNQRIEIKNVVWPYSLDSSLRRLGF